MDDISEQLKHVGPRIKQVREEKNLTLTQVSENTGISVSTLSRLESGQRKATLELLLPLAKLFETPIDDLIGAPPVEDPRVNLRKTRLGNQTVLSLSHTEGNIHAFKHVLDPAPSDEEPDLQTHHGSEWIYVLSGRLRLVLGGKEFLMGAGEAAQFETSIPHWLSNGLTDAQTEFLGLFNSSGKSVHVPQFKRKN